MELADRLVKYVGKKRALLLVKSRYEKEPTIESKNKHELPLSTLSAFYYANLYWYIKENY